MSRPRRPRADIDIHQPTYTLGKGLQSDLDEALRDWRVNDKVRRLWAGDSTLWSGTDESKWLGWLDIAERQLSHLDLFADFAADVRDAGFTHSLLLGMGGSSLCPEVLSATFGQQEGQPRLHVLDSTDPAQVKACEDKLDLAKTLFIVSSKSGSTLEPNLFKQYFFERLEQTLGKGKAGAHFVAVTDRGSKLEEAARRDGFRHIFHGDPTIGGRYSALSHFGMIPAAAMGIEVRRILDRAKEMAIACSPRLPVERNPGAVLGLILGAAANAGRDKLTLIASPGLHHLGAWLEQLLAESTGKQGRGIIPVDREPLGSPEDYGNDRVFAYLSLEGASDAEQDAAIETLEKAGQPVVRLHLRDAYDLGAQFFLWEIATAAAGSVLGINPFDQPDVEASKIVTRAMTEPYESSGTLPVETAFARFDGMAFFADGTNAAALLAARGKSHAGGVTRPGTDGVTPGRSRNVAPRALRNRAEAARNPSGDRHLRPSALSFSFPSRGGDHPDRHPPHSAPSDRRARRAFSFVPRDFHHGLLAGGSATPAGLLKAHLARLGAGDYFALLGYVEMKPEHERILEGIRRMVRDSKKVATCAGFGPRFLHSTGQAYKGGPNSGVFLQITCDDAADVDVPGRKYTFGVVKAAQASGDFQVLAERGRRALRVHLSGDVTTALSRLEGAVREALAARGKSHAGGVTRRGPME